MKDEVTSGKAKSEVVFGQFLLLTVEGSLVTSQPTLVADYSRSSNQGPLGVKVHVSVERNLGILEGWFDVSRLASAETNNKCKNDNKIEGVVLRALIE